MPTRLTPPVDRFARQTPDAPALSFGDRTHDWAAMRDTIGEIVVRGGWVHTGDLGRMDGDGHVHVVDRLKDMIVSGGENVYSAGAERGLPPRFPERPGRIARDASAASTRGNRKMGMIDRAQAA